MVAALPAVLPAGTVVFDGPVPTGDDPARYLSVGWQPSVEDATAGSFTQERGQDGFTATEAGDVLCEIAAVTGDSVVPDAFDIADAVTAWAHGDRTLGGALHAAATTSVAVEVLEAQTRAGATQRLLLTLSYTSLFS
jgi:hypothetical protein